MTHLRPNQSHRVWNPARLAAAGVMLLCVSAQPALATSPCPIGLRDGRPVTLDGHRGVEWDDSTVTTSGGPCFGTLLDLNGSSTARNVTIYSKRFTRAGVGYLGFFFEVPDHTLSASGAPLPNGERIILQFDPNLSGGPSLQNGALDIDKDYRIDIIHKWLPSATDPSRIADFDPSDALATEDGVQIMVKDGSGPPGICTHSNWEIIASVPTTKQPAVVVRKATTTLPGSETGYTAEVEVPLALLGNPAGDIGVALAIVNDFNSCLQSGVCDGYGASFPDGLPVNNADNPVELCMDSWTRPETWATGYRSSPPGDVYFARDPWWNSSDVDALRCGVVDNTWYQPACRLNVRSWLRKSSTTNQVRNVLYLWSWPGIGQREWHVVDLKKNVTITSARQLEDSAEARITDAITEHPCVRAYVMPPTFRPDFDESRIRGGATGILTQAELDTMVSLYGLQAQHHAQQNITLAGTTACPDGVCLAGSLPVTTQRLAWLDVGAEPAAATAELGALVSALSPISRAYADDDREGRQPLPVPSSHPLRTGIGSQVLFHGVERKVDTSKYVMLQVRAFGYRASPVQTTPRYNFIEEIGGIIKMIPLAQLKQKQKDAVRFDFDVGNPADFPRVVFLQADIKGPLGVQIPPLQLDLQPRLFQPGDTQKYTAYLGKRCDCECFDLKCKIECDRQASSGATAIAGSLALFGTVGIGGLAYFRRRLRPQRHRGHGG